MFQNSQPRPARLEHERLLVYEKALSLLEFLESLGPLVGELELRDQLKRASASIALNIAEGASRQSPADKRRFYHYALGSTAETAAALDILRIRRRLSPARHELLRDALIELARMLGTMSRAGTALPATAPPSPPPSARRCG